MKLRHVQNPHTAIGRPDDERVRLRVEVDGEYWLRRGHYAEAGLRLSVENLGFIVLRPTRDYVPEKRLIRNNSNSLHRCAPFLVSFILVPDPISHERGGRLLNHTWNPAASIGRQRPCIQRLRDGHSVATESCTSASHFRSPTLGAFPVWKNRVAIVRLHLSIRNDSLP